MKIEPPRKILLIQIRQLGDVLLCTPVVRAVKKTFPEARLDFLADKSIAPILEGNPNIDRVIAIDRGKPLRNILEIRKNGYDWVIDFLGNPRSALISFLSGAAVKTGFRRGLRSVLYNRMVNPDNSQKYAGYFKYGLVKGLGVAEPGPELDVYLNERDMLKVGEYLNTLEPAVKGPCVCFAPASRRPARRWLPEHYAALGDMLAEKYKADIFILWGPGEEGQAREVLSTSKHKFFMIPKFSLTELAAFIGRCSLMVANSNGPAHIAEALRVPTVTVYGPNDPLNWTSPVPWSKYLRYEELDCIGCGEQVCPKNMECMKNISPASALEFIERNFPGVFSNGGKND